MSPLHLIEYFLFSLCVHLFTAFVYVIYYSSLFLSSSIHEIPFDYDYIIVGSGTAGSLIAHRISKETSYSVIVLEAGIASNSILEIPILGPLLHGTVLDWNYETVTQDNACYAMNGQKCKLTQGKLVGGSSKVNNMIHVRGNISHYVEWFHGKYSVDYLTKQFEYVEKNILQLSELQFESELANGILSAAKELGYSILNSQFDLGFSKSKVSQRNGKRWTTSDNLDIFKYVLTNALVEKVLVKDNIAYGVLFSMSDKKYIFTAKKGVILSAGTYNTPKILQLSGIGPKKLLKSLDIPLVKDLPVGKHLQDHVTTGMDLVLFNKTLSLTTMAALNPLNILKYFYNGKGPFTSPGCEVIGFLSTQNGTVPDLQFMVLPVGLTSDRGILRKVLGIKDKLWYEYFIEAFEKHAATILPILLHPKSKGTVYINSTNAKKPPLINPNYLSNVEDVNILIRGLKLVIQFVETDSMKSFGAHINPVAFPGCEHFKMLSDSYLECYLRHLTLTTYHPVGTCSMGTPESKKSVVDTSFKVLGLKRLYVADGSVLPTLPSGNINAAIAMMANVFFETNIKSNLRNDVCYENDFFLEYLFLVCY